MLEITGRWTPSGWTIELVTHDVDVIMESSSQLFVFGLFELAAKSWGDNKKYCICMYSVDLQKYWFHVCCVSHFYCFVFGIIPRKWVVLNWGFPRNVSRCTISCQLMEYPIERVWHTLVHRWVSQQGSCFSCARDKCGNRKRSHLLPASISCRPSLQALLLSFSVAMPKFQGASFSRHACCWCQGVPVFLRN